MRIVFVGAHGVGKSTLFNHPYFKDNFPNHTFVDSISRKFPKDWSSRHRQFYVNSWYLWHHYIDNNYVSARSIFDPWSYTRLTCGLTFMFYWFNIGVRLIKYDYIFYVPIEFELIDDNFRPLDKDYQIQTDREIKLLLDFYHIKYHTITGTIEERITKIRNIIDL